MNNLLRILGLAGAMVLSFNVGAVNVTELATAKDTLNAVAGNLATDNPALVRAFGLSGEYGLSEIRSHSRPDGRQVHRMLQTYRDIPVWGKHVILWTDSSGRVNGLRGELVSDIRRDIRDITPTLSRDAALDVVSAQFIEPHYGQDAIISREKAGLVIYVTDEGQARLAYEVELLIDEEAHASPSRPIVILDAHSGDVLRSYDALAHQTIDCSSECVLLAETDLSGNASTRGKNKQPADFLMFAVSVPSDAKTGSTLTVQMSEGGGDADLYVQKSVEPTLSSYVCRPYLGGNEESCEIVVSADDTYVVGVYAYQNFSGVSLTATLRAPIVVQKIGDGPGGNQKTGIYYYGSDFDNLDISRSSGQCVFDSVNVKTVDLENGTVGSSAFQYGDGVDCYQASDAVNGAFSPLNDAHYFGNVVYDMYQSYLSVEPLTFKLTMRVHYGSNYENAFWDGSAMTFGDGASTFYPLVSLDVSAHEVSHGFTEQNSNLVYSGQSGGMNEAFSDMAGEAAEFFMRGEADFLVGADIFKGAGSLRYMSNPPADGRSIDHISDYTAGMDVHFSSGVFNKAFYELAVTQQWGVQKTFEVFAWANMSCWSPDSTFQQGAQCVLDEAVNAGYEGLAVADAFAVVGLTLDVPQPPGPPEVFTLDVPDVSFNMVDLSWQTASNVNTYAVERSNNGGAFELIQSNITIGFYTDITVNPATEYSYRVVANNSDGSAYSNVQTVTTDPYPVPGQFSVQPTENLFNSVTLAWSDSSYADTYTINRSTDGGSTFDELATGLTSRSYVDGSVAPDTSYVYQVVASNIAGDTAVEITVKTPVTPVASPISLSVSTYKVKGVNTADLTWEYGDAVRLLVDGTVAIEPLSGGSYTDNTGLKGGMTRTYQLCVVDNPDQCSDLITVIW